MLSMAKSTWMVRAGEGGRFVEDFLGQKLAAIGWKDVGPLSAETTDDEIQRKFLAAYPDWKDGSRRSGAAQVKRFMREVQVGESAVTYDPDRRLYFLGEITGLMDWRPEHELSRLRRVNWTRQVARDLLSATARNTLGSTLTLFRIDESLATELLKKSVPIGSEHPAVSPVASASASPATDPSESIVIKDAEEMAQAFVEDRLARLDEEQIPELIASILKAMGYKTRVSPKGPDRGIDIFASPDGLGLQEPRIFVEVKHRIGTPMGSKEIRAFLGGRQKGDRCLYVSTGGFTKEARYEADRAETPLTLLTLASIRELLLDHYEKLDSDARTLIPLRRVYLPVPE
jgi:restriction system protein